MLPTAVPQDHVRAPVDSGVRHPPAVFDVAVVGAGPAGSVAALQAARSAATVVVFEAQSGTLDKPCGEGLMPEGVDVLEELGLVALLGRGRPFTSIRYRLTNGRALEVPLPRPGLAVPRPELMRGLAEALEAEPRLWRIQRSVRVERLVPPGGDGPRFEIHSGAASFLARTLIAADGQRGASGSQLFPRPESGPTGRIGLRARFSARAPLQDVEVHLGRSGAELYLTPLPDGRINAAALLHGLPDGVRGARSLFESVCALYPAAAAKLGELDTEPALRRLGSNSPARFADRGAFLAGDAGSAVDPVLGCGVTIALTTGRAAARAALDLLAGQPEARVERDFNRLFRREVRARRALADGLCWFGRHPRALSALAIVLGRMPILTRAMLGFVAGSEAHGKATGQPRHATP